MNPRAITVDEAREGTSVPHRIALRLLIEQQHEMNLSGRAYTPGLPIHVEPR